MLHKEITKMSKKRIVGNERNLLFHPFIAALFAIVLFGIHRHMTNIAQDLSLVFHIFDFGGIAHRTDQPGFKPI
jgi:hypothetical protein